MMGKGMIHPMVKIGILGGAGYTAGELIRLLLNHPEAEIKFVNSESNAGNLITDVHEGLYGDTELRFTSEMPFDEVDVVFFCFGHGKSKAFLQEHDIPARVKIIDLAQDFRVSPRLTPSATAPTAEGNPTTTPPYPDEAPADSPLPLAGSVRGEAVYGLPEINRAAIAQANYVANPGCFATCIQLGLLPAAHLQIIQQDVSVNAITGSTGAGVKPSATTHFSWRMGNLSIYKAFCHQHVPEICQSLRQVQGYLDAEIDFIPYRGDFARGIFATEVVRTDLDLDTIVAAYKDFYKDAAFTHYVDGPLDMKQVVNTNKALVHCDKVGNKLLITSCIDNLLKGAVGQAVQNMNLMFGLDETTGLRLKASGF